MSTYDLINAIEAGDSSAIQQHFQAEIMSRVAEKLDTFRIETAKNMFNKSVNEETELDEARVVHPQSPKNGSIDDAIDYHKNEYKIEMKRYDDLKKKGKETGMVGHYTHSANAAYDKAEAHNSKVKYLTAQRRLGNKSVNEETELDEARVVHPQSPKNGSIDDAIDYHKNEYKIEMKRYDDLKKKGKETGMVGHYTHSANAAYDKAEAHNSKVKYLTAQRRLGNNNAHLNEEFDDIHQIDEVLTKNDPASKWIDHFVNSDNPKFAGKSKEERKKQALAAYYAKQKE